ncbi:hypothetical protein AK830_g2267 [Neonectria ditissima]|uniref:Uncharacterized protein n=1 Tax=Neonectria ditissima TaxID=78410 RepID=A0A0P7B3H5_9HYPO|nr:hypothetical protein AK830_g2267 [Neonectria ditissima]
MPASGDAAAQMRQAVHALGGNRRVRSGAGAIGGPERRETGAERGGSVAIMAIVNLQASKGRNASLCSVNGFFSNPVLLVLSILMAPVSRSRRCELAQRGKELGPCRRRFSQGTSGVVRQPEIAHATRPPFRRKFFGSSLVVLCEK